MIMHANLEWKKHCFAVICVCVHVCVSHKWSPGVGNDTMDLIMWLFLKKSCLLELQQRFVTSYATMLLYVRMRASRLAIPCLIVLNFVCATAGTEADFCVRS